MTEERAILAYFKSPDDAQIASERLTHELDVEDVQIDRISGTPGEATEKYMNPLNGKISSHTSLVEGTDDISRKDVGILRGSSPAISGMADGSRGDMISGRDILLTAVVPASVVDQAVQIIDECGGQH
jgi:hypothetical protein